MENIAKAIYVNLDRRVDRRELIESEFANMGITVERFPAVEAHPGIVGCHMSHLTILKKARDEGWENVLIFEDDFMFLVDKETFHSELKRFFDLKIPYDVVMLAYNMNKSEDYNDLVGYARDVQTTAGYIVHKRFYDKLIENLETALPLLQKTGQHWIYALDQCWKSLQTDSEWFYFKTRIGRQRPGYSDLAERFTDYGV